MDTVPVSAGTEDLFDEHAGDDDDDEEDHQTFFRSNAIPQISRKPDEPVPASSNSDVGKKKKKGSYLPRQLLNMRVCSQIRYAYMPLLAGHLEIGV